MVVVLGLAIPILYTLLLYHPADPVHNMLKEFLELEMKPTLQTLIIQICYADCLFIISNTICSLLLLCVMINALVTQWITLTLPKFYSRKSWSRIFYSNKLGLLTDKQICWVFRCSQILCNRWQSVFGTIRLALHFAVYQVIVVSLCFLLIQYRELLVFHNATGIAVLCMICLLACIICCRIECSFIGEMVDRSREYKRACVKNSGRKAWIHKTARSFPTLITSCTYPLFVVNNATYLDFWHICVDNIVSLLCLSD